MKSLNKPWGVAFAVLAALFAALAWGITRWFPPSHHGFFYTTVLPWLGIVSSALAFLLGHFSYPRIQNLKVYLLGYLTAVTGLAYFGLHQLSLPSGMPPEPDGFVPIVYMVLFANGLALPLAPSFVKYRLTRNITWSSAAFEAALLITARFVPRAADWGEAFLYRSVFDYAYWLVVLWVPGTVLLTLRFVRNQFHLGGILAGCNVLAGTAWLTRWSHAFGMQYEPLIFWFLPVFMEIGVLFHWFLRMEHRVAYDPLLHIYNRNYCSQIISEQSKLNVAPPFGVAMVDIDHFKKVNDTYGHQTGDRVLFTVAQTISREVVPEGVLCRYGGEELAVFFPQKKAKEVKTVLESVRKAVENAKVGAKKKQLSVTVSCGISCREDGAQSIASVIASADKALYRAKSGGRNQVRVAKTSMPRSRKR